jgi:hypothetical protein
MNGILYPSRLTGRNCVAVFDHAVATHLEVGMVAPLANLDAVGTALDSINVRLIG